MNSETHQTIRRFIQSSLEQRGDHNALGDDDSLFLSGRLDSLAMMNLVIYLETAFNVDFSAFNFDVSLIDSLHAISKLLIPSRT
ncbi:MAG: acyl carrier protein [Betaproteobacteria bacterium]|nr:acyl carrier protein [Betaproteobacteria bacterium]NBY04597.1 acyl carrier protein [Betaproteobacteria bacterium]